ncbi:hypothetical protein AMEX_G3867 [Astyanax mexicanus]|uniref:Chromo domain-containing protein n=1 Tax=Astyanax mexicanus TaxID=7994 RepID=A0A8T2M4Q9_ASTMX|nr:hypothetical protein AMEX_G5954 [Astyanax mexicanus]KAG9281085.1 hypothetical protein AMEX_G3867 [Astyanax mexicanus]
MPGSTKKTCLSCKLQINVGCKSCKLCGASQPQKIKLESAKNKISKEWAQKILNGRNTSKLINSANLLLHKFHVLGYYPLLLLGKRKAGKTSNFGAEVLCTHQFSSQMEKTTISTIRLLYEGLLKVVLNPESNSAENQSSSNVSAQSPSPLDACMETANILDASDPPTYTLILTPVTPELENSGVVLKQVNHSSFGAPEVSPSSSGAPEVSPSSSGAPEVSPSSSGAPEVNPSSSGAPEVNPSSSCAPEVSPSSSGAPEVNPSSSGAPEVSPSFSGAPEVNPSSSGAPEVNPSSSGTNKFSSRKRTQKILSKVVPNLVNPSSSSAPEVNPSSLDTKEFSSRKRTQKILSKVVFDLVNPSTSCAPEVNPSSSGAPEVNPSSSCAPEVNPSSLDTNKFSSRKRTQKILSKVSKTSSSFGPTFACRKRRMFHPNDCPVHTVAETHPFEKILSQRVSEEGTKEVKVRWKQCSGCGIKWKDTWEPFSEFFSAK